MIPEYLQGKNTEYIMDKVSERFHSNHPTLIGDEFFQAYIEELEVLLSLAVRYALCNADSENYGFVGREREIHAEDRAVIFLNRVLPKES